MISSPGLISGKIIKPTAMKAKILLMSVLAPHLCICQTFTQITSSPLSTIPGDSRSVNWIDVNNDGYIDCMITNGPAGGQNNSLYLNDGNGGFSAVTADPVVSDNSPSDGATWADTDNDGDADCFVVNWYNVNNLYYTNNGNGTFNQITSGTQVNDAGYSETASWGDYDNDGFVDLYVTNSAGSFKNFLYHNDQNGSFTKITTGAMVNDASASRSVNWTDMDNDGDVDLFVTNENNQNENIYRNDGNGTFTKIIAGALVTNGGNTMSSSWADYDNDGDLDVFVANDAANNALFRNEGNFTFTKIAADTVSTSGGNSFSSAWSDIDNDGDVDLYVTNSFHSVLQVNFLYINNGNGSFSRVSNTSPATITDWSYGCAFGDYDNDGFEDLAVATCAFNNIDRPDLLFHNDGNSNHWIKIKVTGGPSNKSGIGAKIRVKAIINATGIWQLREVSAQSSYCGQNDLRQHFGLGNATSVDSIKVEWPSGNVEYYLNQQADEIITITEGTGITVMHEFPDKSFKIFPNPSNGSVTIMSEINLLNAGDEIVISNMEGKIISSFLITKTTASFTVDIIEHGIFFISIKNESGIVRKKLINF
jgi:enediyne biosynthesis protein E4